MPASLYLMAPIYPDGDRLPLWQVTGSVPACCRRLRLTLAQQGDG